MSDDNILSANDKRNSKAGVGARVWGSGQPEPDYLLTLDCTAGAPRQVFVLNKVKNGPKRPYNRLKRAKKVQKRQKIGKKKSSWTKKTCFLAEFSLAELGGTPPP